jgi:hypothetical protein
MILKIGLIIFTEFPSAHSEYSFIIISHHEITET